MTTEQNKSPPQHTPGPWIAWDDNRTIGFTDDNGEPFAIAEVVDHGDMAPDALLRADLNLIAAAPELLEALEDIEALPPDDYGDRTIPAGFLDNARAIIAKARGQA